MSAMSPPPERFTDQEIDPVFLSRWSRRGFCDEPIAVSQLFTLFEAARWAPSAKNAQPWRFLYSRRHDANWPVFLDLLYPRNRIWAQRAAALIAVVSRTVHKDGDGIRPSPTHAFDAGAAWALLALQAHRDGLNTRAIGGFDRACALKALGLPGDYEIHAFVAVGRAGPAGKLPDHLQGLERPTPRRAASEFVAAGLFPWSDE